FRCAGLRTLRLRPAPSVPYASAVRCTVRRTRKESSMQFMKEGTAIEARGDHKSYPSAATGDRPALDGFELRVPVGTVHGLLGPNGAGRTTALRIMATLLELDEGEVRVAGSDAAKQGRQVRRHIGLVGQYPAADEELTGMQNLVMFGRLSRLSPRAARARADELLEQFG